MIWPKKKNSQKIAGRTLRLPLPPVRFEGNKCLIFINGKEELLDDEGFIIEINVDNSRPLKIKLFPDYKAKKLNAIEILDVNDNREYAKESPKLEFVGIGSLSKDDIKKRVEFYLDRLDDDQIKFNKRARFNSWAIIILLSLVLVYQLYSTYSQTGLLKYINIILSIIDVILILFNIKIINRTYKTDKRIKDREKDREESPEIEIVKEK